MSEEIITTDEQLSELCASLATAGEIALDTEFVSEDTYLPELCVIQVATRNRLAVIDVRSISEINAFWSLIAEGSSEVVVHAAREELCFCLTAIGQPIGRMFDTQIAAGLVGAEYPAGYASLVSRYLGTQPDKGQTRTDWRRRPLTRAQVRYALEDVRYLLPLRDALSAELGRLGRVSWLAEEMAAFQQGVQQSRTRQRWRKTSGISGLSQRSLAIAREIWLWRDEEARRRNIPAKRVLRDDLLIEIAKRRSADAEVIRSIRGMGRPNLRRDVDQLAGVVQKGLRTPAPDLPPRPRRDSLPQVNLLGQFLASALSSMCRQAEIAPSIVGTASDIRELVVYRLGARREEDGPLPSLAQGWRAQIVGSTIEKLLDGQMAIRIENPLADHPLVFEPIDSS